MTANTKTYRIPSGNRIRGPFLLVLFSCIGALISAGCATQAVHFYKRPIGQTKIGLVLIEGYAQTELFQSGITPNLACLEANIAPSMTWNGGIFITRVGEKSYRTTFPNHYDAGSFFYKDLANALIKSGKKNGLEIREINSASLLNDGFHGKSLKSLLNNSGSALDLDATWVVLYNIRSGVIEGRIEPGASSYFYKEITTTYEGLTATIYPLFIDNSSRTLPGSVSPKSISIKRQQGEHMEDVEERVLDGLVDLFEDSFN